MDTSRRLSPLLALLLLIPVLPVGTADAQEGGAGPDVMAGCVIGSGVALFPPDGGDPQPLVPDAESPDVSPDGTRVAYVALTEKMPQVFVLDRRTGQSRQVTQAVTMWSEPDWAPDGRTLAMTEVNGETRIAVVDTDAQTPQPRFVPGTERGRGPSWSPDGHYLAFTGPDGIVALSPDGRGRTVLRAHGYAPAWSPAGREILFTAGDGDVGVLTLPDRAERWLLQSAGYRSTYGHASWSSDAQYVYAEHMSEYVPYESGEPGHSSRTILRTRATAAPSYDGDRIYRTADSTGCPSLGGGPPPPAGTGTPSVSDLRLTAHPSRLEVDATLSADASPAGVIVRYGPGAVAPLTPQDGLDGGRSLLGRATLHRLSPSTTYSVTVFPVSWSGRVGEGRSSSAQTPAEVATSLAVEPARTTYLVAGSYLELRGRLLREDTGTPLAGAPVQLLARTEGRPDVLVTTLTSDADGWVSSRRQPLTPTRYTLRFQGQQDLLPAVGTALALVQPQVRVTLSATVVRRGAPASVLVQVRPSRPGINVRVNQWHNERLVLTRLVRLDRNSAVRVPLDTRSRGVHEVEVQTGANTDLEPASVPKLRLDVR